MNLSISPVPTLSQGTCATCGMQQWCVPVGDDTGVDHRAEIRSHCEKVTRGHYIYRTGEAFHALYAVRTGSFKTVRVSAQGDEQVIGLFGVGDLLGLDAIGTDTFIADAVALEDSSVCVIPFARLEQFTRAHPELQHQLHRLISKEILREQQLRQLHSFSAEQRVAAFLQWMAEQHARRGYSASRFVLRLKRGDIGNLLGLTAETVIRTLSQLDREGVVAVRQREVNIKDADALARIANAQS